MGKGTNNKNLCNSRCYHFFKLCYFFQLAIGIHMLKTLSKHSNLVGSRCLLLVPSVSFDVVTKT